MKNHLGLLIGFVFLIFILLGLNAATYVQKEKVPDSESSPNRSSFNPGSTGTQAFYALLSETGHNVKRWQSGFDRLKGARADEVATLFIIGRTRRPIEAVEYDQLLAWVARGGTLVYIDRAPPERLRNAIDGWKLRIKNRPLEPTIGVDPASGPEMVKDVAAIKPVQPTAYTVGVNAVQASKFASGLLVIKEGDPADKGDDAGTLFGPNLLGQKGNENVEKDETVEEFSGPLPNQTTAPPPPAASPAQKMTVNADSDDASDGTIGFGPVVSLENDLGAVLLDANYGAGRIVFLTDPYIVSNAGVATVDNAQLGIALAGNGPTAFDEYHQGFGDNENQLFRYFAGTPVIALFAQLLVVVAAVMFSKSRRFARPVPEPEPDRLTKLEYVSAMAELQNRTEAYDLALENIYGDFRRRAARLVGVDNMRSSRRELAMLLTERSRLSAAQIEDLMVKCENIVHSSDSTRKETIDAVTRLRDLEAELGLDRSRKGVPRR